MCVATSERRGVEVVRWETYDTGLQGLAASAGWLRTSGSNADVWIPLLQVQNGGLASTSVKFSVTIL